VEVDGRIGHEDLEKIKRGMWLGPDRGSGVAPMNSRHGPDAHATGATKTERFKVKLLGRERGRTILELRVSEGKNREIRRVMARIGHTVRDLNRVAIAGKVTIKGLEVGKFRALTAEEVKWLFRASSAEFHGGRRAATQAWYEAKEMEKERRRLEREEKEKLEARSPRAQAPAREFRPRPVRKGKKPFVPPSGRNAGKLLGGNFAGRQRLEREFSKEPAGDVPMAPHPLGDEAQGDQ